MYLSVAFKNVLVLSFVIYLMIKCTNVMFFLIL